MMERSRPRYWCSSRVTLSISLHCPTRTRTTHTIAGDLCIVPLISCHWYDTVENAPFMNVVISLVLNESSLFLEMVISHAPSV